MSDYFIERDIKSNIKKLKEVFNIISLTGKYKVIGSSNLKNFRYNSDFDLANFVDNDKKISIKKIVQYFQSIYKTFDKKPITNYITDFKCGIDSNNEPLHWIKKEVLNNKKLLLNKSYITLDEAIQQKSTIKIDVISYINNTFIEISENYYIKIKNNSNFNEKELNETNIINSIKESEKEEIKDDNFNKSLKRQFSWRYAKNKDDPKLKELEQFFNSDVGILNKTRSDLDTLILLLEKVESINIDQILNALDIMKFQNSYNLIKDYTFYFLKIIAIKDKKKLYKLLVQLRNNIYNLVNKHSKIFYKKLI
jgi:hypothetical protein